MGHKYGPYIWVVFTGSMYSSVCIVSGHWQLSACWCRRSYKIMSLNLFVVCCTFASHCGCTIMVDCLCKSRKIGVGVSMVKVRVRRLVIGIRHYYYYYYAVDDAR